MLLGIDVGGTSVKYATCDEKGHLFDKGSFKTPDTLEDMYQAIETIYKEKPLNLSLRFGLNFSINSK